MRDRKEPIKICKAAGHEFRIYREFDEQMQTYYLTYPDFSETPMHTDEGRPFTRSDYEGCPFYKTKNTDNPADECGDCVFFHREETPRDVIGICICEKLKRETKGGNTK